MSKAIRQTALSGLFGSKRFIVSVCAAIAMVLGAFSVGASVFVPPSVVEGQERAAQSPVFTERNSSNNANDTGSDGNTFTQQHTLMPDTLTRPKSTDNPPTKAVPKAKAGLGIHFGPINGGAGISLGALQIKLDTSIVQPALDAIPEIISPIEMPVIETPEAEQTPEEPPDAPVDAKPNPAAETLPMTDAAAQP